MAVVLLAISVATPASAADRRVRIVNNTGYTIVEFYGSNKGTDSWEEDILGYDVIGPYSALIINFDDGTGYCIRFQGGFQRWRGTDGFRDQHLRDHYVYL